MLLGKLVAQKCYGVWVCALACELQRVGIPFSMSPVLCPMLPRIDSRVPLLCTWLWEMVEGRDSI